MTEITIDRRKHLIRYTAASYFALLCAIALTWHLGGWSESDHAAYLLLWTCSAAAFAVGCIVAFTHRERAFAGSLLLTGGTLCIPVGIPAIAVGLYSILKRDQKERAIGLALSVALLVAMSFSIALISPQLKERPFDARGLLRGAPLSWCSPANMLALLRGTEYGDLRHLALICTVPKFDFSGGTERVTTDGPKKRFSFAALGYTREHMREVNAILRENLGPDYHPKDDMARFRLNQAQRAAVGYLAQRIDRTKLRETGLIPVLVVDDAITTGELLRSSAGQLAQLAFTKRDRNKEPGIDGLGHE